MGLSGPRASPVRRGDTRDDASREGRSSPGRALAVGATQGRSGRSGEGGATCARAGSGRGLGTSRGGSRGTSPPAGLGWRVHGGSYRRFPPEPQPLGGERGNRAERYVPKVHLGPELAEKLQLLALLGGLEDQLVGRVFGKDRADPIPLDRPIAVVDPDTTAGFTTLDDHPSGLQRAGVGDLRVGLLER